MMSPTKSSLSVLSPDAELPRSKSPLPSLVLQAIAKKAITKKIN
jgi:hypothetical protein